VANPFVREVRKPKMTEGEEQRPADPRGFRRYRKAVSAIISISFGLAILIHLVADYGLDLKNAAYHLLEEIQYFNPYLIENDYFIATRDCEVKQAFGSVKVDLSGDQIMSRGLRDAQSLAEARAWQEEYEKGQQFLLCPKLNVYEILKIYLRMPYGYKYAALQFYRREDVTAYFFLPLPS
jgi:hypothetical protein